MGKVLEVHLPVKPFSANRMHYANKKVDTKDYKVFKEKMSHELKPYHFKVDANDKYKLSLIVGYSSKLSDLDNAFKPTLDSMQLALGFDDRQIFEIEALKEHVKKGEEFMMIRLETLTEKQWIRRMGNLFAEFWKDIKRKA